MKPRYDYGIEVRLIRNVRNDGTYPGEEVGRLLVRSGEIGVIYDVGSYLQDQIIYRVHFLGAGRTVGCREEELILATDPWIANKYEFRDRVVSNKMLAVNGEIIAESGEEGEIEKVIKQPEQEVFYHVRFKGRVLHIPESVLSPKDLAHPASSAPVKAAG